ACQLNLWTSLEIIATLRRQSNIERLAALFLTLAGKDLADGLHLKVAQSDLAAMAATGRTTLVAALRKLEDLGLVSVGCRSIVPCDVAGLQALRDGEGAPRAGGRARVARA
ncbi:MAG: helix-turn-helix domain-containing protein, partial [Sphingomonadaceae bacterium]